MKSESDNAKGWIQQWDQNSQRFYYLEQATGRTQWEPPSFPHGAPSGLPPGGYGHGYAGEYGNQHVGQGGSGDSGQHGHDKDKSSALKYGLGGAAVGALAGGVIAHEMTEESDDEGHHVTQTTTYAAAPAPASDSYGSAPVSTPLVSSLLERSYLTISSSHQPLPRTKTANPSQALKNRKLKRVAKSLKRRRRITTRLLRKVTRADSRIRKVPSFRTGICWRDEFTHDFSRRGCQLCREREAISSLWGALPLPS
jgi:WW domain